MELKRVPLGMDDITGMSITSTHVPLSVCTVGWAPAKCEGAGRGPFSSGAGRYLDKEPQVNAMALIHGMAQRMLHGVLGHLDQLWRPLSSPFDGEHSGYPRGGRHEGEGWGSH